MLMNVPHEFQTVIMVVSTQMDLSFVPAFQDTCLIQINIHAVVKLNVLKH